MAEVDVYRIYIDHPDDWRFVRGLTHHAPSHVLPALFCAYLASWRNAAMKEKVAHLKDNAGRRAANSRLRVDSQRMEAGDKATRQRYASLVQQGPKKACTTCKHCSLLGKCSLDLKGPGDACPEWKADFT